MDAAADKRRENDLRVANDIEKFGCHVISVFDPEQQLPPFTYSVGIRESAGAPDALVIGVRPELGHFLINEYNERVRGGEQFVPGVPYDGFLEGFAIYVEPATDPTVRTEYTLGCTRRYDSEGYDVVQLVYPSTAGIWPWDEEAGEWFKANQPMLGRARIG